MTTNTPVAIDNETEELAVYGDNSYLNYSMYTIMNRALPHVADGLKPVQRRLVYAMSELRLTAQAKYKKSARTVGDTLGKFHPHGDSACYEAMVLLAQPFSTLYPLVDGQGNWGSVDDPSSFAAMRYTESKLTIYAESLISELGQDTVDWAPNFDGTIEEPRLLPAQLPNILLNGATGIAVGMATDIPPHHLPEILAACIDTLQRARITDEEILAHVTFPEFPSGGVVITPLDKLKECYRTGRGSLTLRASYEVDGDVVYITSVPYRLSASKIIERIDEQIKEHKLPVDSMSDKSDINNPIRLAMTIKGADAQARVMAHLFANTELESTIKINLNMIGLNERPQVKSFATIIREWCEYRQMVFVRKNNFRLRAVEARLHILEGLLLAYMNLDAVIRIVRESDDPKEALIASYGLSPIQAQAILELRLRQLAKLEESTLRSEQDALLSEQHQLKELLSDDQKIKRAMVKELKAAAQPHLRPRKTIHAPCERSDYTFSQAATTSEPMTVVMSQSHWLRALKGHDLDLSKLPYKNGDRFAQSCETHSNLSAIFMGDRGRFFGVPVAAMPNGKSMGEPITTQITLQDGEKVFALLPYLPDKNLLLTTRKGNGFLTPMAELDTRAKKGKQVLNLTDGDAPLRPIALSGDETELAMVTKSGRLVIIPLDSLNMSNKSQGTRLVDIKLDDFDAGHDALMDIVPLRKEQSLIVHAGARKFVLTDSKKEMYRAQRARRGIFFEGGRSNLSLAIE
jgi:topoisomerase-4 subunit A